MRHNLYSFIGASRAGKTTTILNIAYLLAKKYKVLVVDASQKYGRIELLYDAAGKDTENITKDIVDVIRGLNIPLKEAVKKDKKTNIDFIGIRDKKIASFNDCSLSEATSFYTKACDEYDYVLVDCDDIVYEAMTIGAIINSDETYIVEIEEERSKKYAIATNYILESLNKEPKKIIISESEDEFSEDNIRIPFIDNMKEYENDKEIFLYAPTGKNLKRYKETIMQIIDEMGDENVQCE